MIDMEMFRYLTSTRYIVIYKTLKVQLERH